MDTKPPGTRGQGSAGEMERARADVLKFAEAITIFPERLLDHEDPYNTLREVEPTKDIVELINQFIETGDLDLLEPYQNQPEKIMQILKTFVLEICRREENIFMQIYTELKQIVGKDKYDLEKSILDLKRINGLIDRHISLATLTGFRYMSTWIEKNAPKTAKKIISQFNKNIQHDTSKLSSALAMDIEYIQRQTEKGRTEDAQKSFERLIQNLKTFIQPGIALNSACVLRAEQTLIQGETASKADTETTKPPLQTTLAEVMKAMLNGTTQLIKKDEANRPTPRYSLETPQEPGEINDRPGIVQLFIEPEAAELIQERGVDVATLAVIINNSTKNSLRHAEKIAQQEGEIHITISITEDNGSIEISMQDTGSGFPSSEKILEALVTSANNTAENKRSLVEKIALVPELRARLSRFLIISALLQRKTSVGGHGTGIGLDKMFKLTNINGGYIELADIIGGGAEVKIIYPQAGRTPEDDRILRLDRALQKVGWKQTSEDEPRPPVLFRFYEEDRGWTEIYDTVSAVNSEVGNSNDKQESLAAA